MSRPKGSKNKVHKSDKIETQCEELPSKSEALETIRTETPEVPVA